MLELTRARWWDCDVAWGGMTPPSGQTLELTRARRWACDSASTSHPPRVRVGKEKLELTRARRWDCDTSDMVSLNMWIPGIRIDQVRMVGLRLSYRLAHDTPTRLASELTRSGW